MRTILLLSIVFLSCSFKLFAKHSSDLRTNKHLDELPTVQFATTLTDVNEAEATSVNGIINCLPYVDKIITVKISKAPSQPVTISFSNPGGTALQGQYADYSIAPSSFVLQAGILSQDIVVRIYNDAIVEGKEQASLTYSLSNATGGDAVRALTNQSHTIKINDDDFEPTASGAVEVISENFNNHSLPTGWKATGTGYPKSWAVMDFGASFALDPNGHPYLGIDGYQSGGQLEEIVETSTFNAIGVSSINLSFLEFFSVQNNDADAKAFVEVWNGNNWENVWTQNKETGTSGSWNAPAIVNLSIPISHASSAMKFRFRYTVKQKYLANCWVLDNVKVTATFHTNIKSDLSITPDQQYLGPNETVHFYDPTSGDLIAKIKNLTAHDYGCTSVEVDRAGIDQTAWVGSNKITKKTFKVTPTNNNPAGEYEITIYYKASELPNFNGNAIKSMGKSEGGINNGTLANSVTGPVQMSAFNGDFAYTATFDTGFSGFGLSDAGPSGALPVILSRFEGKHTAEGNLLLWETAAEVNNDYFVLERSRDARKFDEISKIAGIGTSAISNSYSYTDSRYEAGLNYYRLKQVDKDGSFAYSKMISLESHDKKDLKIFPNPVQSLLTVELPDLETKHRNVKIINSAGQAVVTKQKLKSDKGKMYLDVSKLPTGIYEVVVSDDMNAYKFSVIKVL